MASNGQRNEQMGWHFFFVLSFLLYSASTILGVWSVRFALPEGKMGFSVKHRLNSRHGWLNADECFAIVTWFNGKWPRKKNRISRTMNQKKRARGKKENSEKLIGAQIYSELMVFGHFRVFGWIWFVSLHWMTLDTSNRAMDTTIFHEWIMSIRVTVTHAATRNYILECLSGRWKREKERGRKVGVWHAQAAIRK